MFPFELMAHVDSCNPESIRDGQAGMTNDDLCSFTNGRRSKSCGDVFEHSGYDMECEVF
jgi:hypothetical protein